jgi:ribosome-associated protein
MNNKELELAKKAAAILDGKKAQDVIIIDIRSKASFADYFVLASGTNERMVGSLSEEVEDQLGDAGMEPHNIEGDRHSGWILMDYGDVIVNVLSTEMRDRYNIEKVWGDCTFITLEDSDNE